MSTLRQAAQQALEALKSAAIFVDSFRGQKATQEAIADLRAALEQPEQEPVAWMEATTGSVASDHEKKMGYVLDGIFNIPLYTASPPPQRQWVGLTEEEVSALSLSRRYLVREVEAKLKERNT